VEVGAGSLQDAGPGFLLFQLLFHYLPVWSPCQGEKRKVEQSWPRITGHLTTTGSRKKKKNAPNKISLEFYEGLKKFIFY
jgi:hypothetical protein